MNNLEKTIEKKKTFKESITSDRYYAWLSYTGETIAQTRSRLLAKRRKVALSNKK